MRRLVIPIGVSIALTIAACSNEPAARPVTLDTFKKAGPGTSRSDVERILGPPNNIWDHPRWDDCAGWQRIGDSSKARAAFTVCYLDDRVAVWSVPSK
jgi:hypothetical protein